MKSTILATAALVAATAVDAVGSAVVVNACTYDVYLFNTPSADGGYTEIDKTLSPGGSYSQQYTELSNGNGWSLKLSKSTTIGNILQYEYTFHNDGIIWYDLSAVDGNPWDSNWEITSDRATCVPRQAAYRYATDDAYGMQACPDDSVITVTLCSGESQNDGAASSASVSASAQTATATSSVATTPAVSTTMKTSVVTSATPPATTSKGHHWGRRDAHHHAARHPHAKN